MVADRNAVDHSGIPEDRTRREMFRPADMAHRAGGEACHWPRCPNAESGQRRLQLLIDICGTSNIGYPLIEIADDNAGFVDGVRKWLRQSCKIGTMVLPCLPVAAARGYVRHVPWNANRNDINISEARRRSPVHKATWRQGCRSDGVDLAPRLPAPDGYFSASRNDGVAGIRITGSPMPPVL